MPYITALQQKVMHYCNALLFAVTRKCKALQKKKVIFYSVQISVAHVTMHLKPEINLCVVFIQRKKFCANVPSSYC